MSDDTPTLKLAEIPDPSRTVAAPLPTPSSPPPAPQLPRPSRAPLVAFIVVAVLVVVASGVLAYVLLGHTGTNAAVGTPSPTATPPASTPVVAPPAPPAGQFTSLVTPQTERCGPHGPGPGQGPGHNQQNLEVSWATVDATQVWVAPGTQDAQTAGGEQVPVSGDQDAFADPIPIDCHRREQQFTITLVGEDGQHLSRSWTVTVDDRH